MNILLSLLIVAAGADAPTEPVRSDRTEVFACDFGPEADKNFDGWPDGWSRQQRLGFPAYLEVKIADGPSPAGNRCLKMVLDGGAAVAYSPPIEVDSLYAYLLEGTIRTEGLVYHRAWLSIDFKDEKHQVLEVATSDKILANQDWRGVTLGPVPVADEKARYAVIGLHLEPVDGADLKGWACFSDLALRRRPQLSLVANSLDHVYGDPGQVEIRFRAAGFTDPDSQVQFTLEDELGQPILEVRKTLQTHPAMSEGPLPLAGDSVPLVGSLTWKPPLPGPGFYRVGAVLRDRQGLGQQRELTLAVIEPAVAGDGGQFGWSLPRGDRPLALPALGRLLGRVGINWVKYPLWYDPDGSQAEVEQLVLFGDRLNGQGIGLVGLLNRPPKQILDRFHGGPPPQAADVFSAGPEVWSPSLQSVLARLATRVHWWQLGEDRDTSFIGYPDLPGKIAQIKAELDQVVQDVNLGIGWDWTHQLPRGAPGGAAWRSLSLSTQPPLTSDELSQRLSDAEQAGAARWVSFEPLPRGEYSTQVRAVDLVRRMMAAVMHGVEGIYITDPFDPQRGLMNGDGTAGELLLPWRTAAVELRGARYLGNIRLPGGSQNRIFARGDEALMVVWNDRPVSEVLYLGQRVRQVDLWGRVSRPAMEGHRQVIEVGPLPVFLRGVNKAVAEWRMSLAFDHTRIPSIFGRRHGNHFKFTNHFPRGVTGTARMVVADGWQVDPPQSSFRLDGGQQQQIPLQLTLPYSADNGRHTVRVDFEVLAGELVRFSVFRYMDLGLGDVYIRVHMGINERGHLEVRQEFVNETAGPVSFRCQLFIPNRRRLKTQIIGLAPGIDVKTYELSDGQQLSGKTLWLRAVEIDGPRILNYRFVVK